MEKQASSRHCFVCGVHNDHGLKLAFFNQEPGVVVARFVICEKHQGYPGIAHGGVVAAILDEVAGRTFMAGDPPRFLVTAKLSVRYRRPVPIGQPLIAFGRSVEEKGKFSTASGQIFDQNQVLLAEAEVVLANIPDEITKTMQVEPDDWRVYPESEVG